MGGQFASGLVGGDLLALFGDLGSGKTTFVKGLAHSLGVEKNIKSPTYNIVKIYPINHSRIKNLVHIDAYRLNSSADTESIGLDEIIRNKENVTFIEWPENVWLAIETEAKQIKFVYINENSRQISYRD